MQEELRDMHSDAIQRLTYELTEETKRKLEDSETKLRLKHRQELDELMANHKAEIGVSQSHQNRTTEIKLAAYINVLITAL